MLEAVRDLRAGGSPMSSQIARKLVRAFVDQLAPTIPQTPAVANTNSSLCAREREILALLSQGYRYKEIADKLSISIHTVRTFIWRMYEKLQVHSRTVA